MTLPICYTNNGKKSKQYVQLNTNTYYYRVTAIFHLDNLDYLEKVSF